MVKGAEISAYRNRYGKTSQNVLAATNFDLEFIYVLSGWEGSAHDSRILNDALTRRNGLKLPPGTIVPQFIYFLSYFNLLSLIVCIYIQANFYW